MLAGTIWRFWWTRGQIAEASRWYERAFAVAANASETARARGLFGAAHMAEARGDVDQAIGGLALCGFFAIVVLATEIPVLVLPPCSW